MRVDVHSIKVPKNRLRKLDQKEVDRLANSMNQGRMLNPIIVNDGTLVAGAHRLAAAKQLGWTDINVSFQGNVQKPATLELIEIDENLIRSELTDSERSHHAARRIELVIELNLPAMIKKVATAKVQTGEVKKPAVSHMIDPVRNFSDAQINPLPTQSDDDALTEEEAIELGHELNKLRTSDMIDDGEGGEIRLVEVIKPMSASEKKVLDGAEAAARAEAIKETAELTGESEGKIRQQIRAHEAVKGAGLDRDDLNKLDETQFKRVADVAHKALSEKHSTTIEDAKNELAAQIIKKKDEKTGRKESAVSHDRQAYILQQVKYAKDAITRMKSKSLRSRLVDFTEHDEKRFTEAMDAMEWVVKILKSQAGKAQ